MQVFSDNNTNLYKILVAAKYNGVNLKVSNSEAEVKNSPVGKLPLLKDNGKYLFEPNAIARHVARSGKKVLYGKNDFEAAQVDQWIDFSMHEIELPAAVWVLPILGKIANNAAATQRAKGDIRKVLEVLNRHLLNNTFLVGQTVSLADIVVAFALFDLYTHVLDDGFRKQFGNVNRWFLTCVNQPEFKSVDAVAGFKICSSMATAGSGAAAAPAKQAKKEQPKKKEQKKKEQPKKEEPKKEEKKEEPKKELPKLNFDFEAWKRQFSNEKDVKGVVAPYLWDKFDHNAMSVWFCNYNYDDENTLLWMTSNLVEGWMQRLDRPKFRRVTFGITHLCNEKPTKITGMWFFHGHEIPFDMWDSGDSESYTWTRADLNKDEDKALIVSYLTGEGKLKEGYEVAETIVYK